jgi:DNA polymerase III sliding clamp (beta) subunit (PCNA family)
MIDLCLADLILVYAASKDETKPHLCCVYFDKENCSIVATDGHKLVYREKDLSKLPESLLVPANTIHLLLKRKKDIKDFGATLQFDKDNNFEFIINGTNTQRIAFEKIKLAYPRWKTFISESKAAYTIGINTALLNDIAKCYDTPKITQGHFKFEIKDKLAPIKISNHEDSATKALVMPLKV